MLLSSTTINIYELPQSKKNIHFCCLYLSLKNDIPNKYLFRIYLRTRAITHAQVVLATTCALFRPQKTYFLLSEGSKSLIITFFLFTEFNSMKNITMLKKLPDHFQNYFSRPPSPLWKTHIKKYFFSGRTTWRG